MATPILENELYKLRLRLGDVYTLDGEEFASSPTSNLIQDGHEWTSKQLVYIYNASVIRYIQYILDNQPDKMSNFIQGYIVVDRIGIGGTTDGLIAKSTFTIPIFRVISFILKKTAGDPEVSKYKTIEPMVSNRWFSNIAEEILGIDRPTPDSDLPRCFYTEVSALKGDPPVLTDCFAFEPTNIFGTGVKLLSLYVKKHIFINIGDTGDLPTVSQYAQERILDFAELMAIRFREYLRAEQFSIDKTKLEEKEYISGKGDIFK